MEKSIVLLRQTFKERPVYKTYEKNRLTSAIESFYIHRLRVEWEKVAKLQTNQMCALAYDAYHTTTFNQYQFEHSFHLAN